MMRRQRVGVGWDRAVAERERESPGKITQYGTVIIASVILWYVACRRKASSVCTEPMSWQPPPQQPPPPPATQQRTSLTPTPVHPSPLWRWEVMAVFKAIHPRRDSSLLRQLRSSPPVGYPPPPAVHGGGGGVP